MKNINILIKFEEEKGVVNFIDFGNNVISP